jgi:F-type H+-transporting ATPase subunit epsilon
MFQLSIITPESTVYEGEADSVTLPTPDGEITVLTGHVPLMTVLAPGAAVVRKGNSEELFAMTRGVIEVTGKTVTILAEIADRADSLEEAAIEEAKAKAEQLITERRHADTESFAEAAAMLERELARLKTVRRRHLRNLR